MNGVDAAVADGLGGRNEAIIQGVNRGIVVASLYSAAVLLALGYVDRYSLGGQLREFTLYLWGAMGFLAGAIAGFSNTEAGESGARDFLRNATDAVMVAAWAGTLTLGANLVSPYAPGPDAVLGWGVFSAAVMVGSVVGEPALTLFARTSIKGRRPFLFVNRITASIEDPNTRFLVRVGTQSVVFALLVALAMTVMFAVLFLLVLALGLWAIGAMLGDSPGTRTVWIPKRGRLRGDGRIVKETSGGERSTGQRIDKDGKVLRETWGGEEEVGLRIDEQGRILKQGVLGESPTGARLKDTGGVTHVVREGFLVDSDTGLRLDQDGRSGKDGLLGRKEAGFMIDDEGKITES
jgi:hypothetical protein